LKSLLSDALAVVREMKRVNFDLLIAEAFRLQGFSVVEFNDADAPDRPDLGLVKAGKKFCVQCRHWQEPTVGIDAVEELECLVLDRAADGGFLVTAGKVSEDAQAIAKDRKIQLVSGPKLLAMLEKAKETITTGVPAHWQWDTSRATTAGNGG
jgi:restriction system protein